MEFSLKGTAEEPYLKACWLNPGKVRSLLFCPGDKIPKSIDKDVDGLIYLNTDPAPFQGVDFGKDVTILGPRELSSLGVKSVCRFEQSGIEAEVSDARGADGKHFGSLALFFSQSEETMRNSVGILKFNQCDDVDSLNSVLSLVDKKRPSLLFHAIKEESFSPQDKELYSDWFKMANVNQHAFLHPNYVLEKDASIEKELKVLSSIPYICLALPLKFDRPVYSSGKEISMTSPWSTIQTSSAATFEQKRSFSSFVSEEFQDKASLAEMKKEYEQNRKNYSAEKRNDLKAKRDKVNRANENSLVNAIGSISLHVLNNGCVGTVPSVSLKCGTKTFLFNCGEGTQLAILEGSKSLKNIDYVLIGSNDYERFAGFAPLMLTGDAWGSYKVTAYGSSQFKQHVTGNYTMLRYLENIDMSNLEFKDIFEHPLEDAVKIEGVRVDSSEPEKNPVVCFICHLPERPGAFSIEKAKKFGIKPGPLVGKLKKGQSVTLEDGKVVDPADVLEPSVKFGPVVFIDICDTSYLDSFVDNEKWKTLEVTPSFFVHFSSPELVSNPNYQSFLKKFPETSNVTKHLFLNESEAAVSSVEGIYHVNYLLNKCCPQVFPLIQGSAFNSWKEKSENDADCHIAAGHKFDLWKASGKVEEIPGLNLTEQALNRTDPQFYKIFGQTTRVLDYESVFSSEKFKDFSQSINSWIDQNRCKDHPVFPRLVCLGTSSAGPSKYRNVSGYYFQLSPDKSIVLDCGENSYAQLVRHFGIEECRKKLTQVGLIFVSHTHADHIGGLPLFLVKRMKAFEELQVPYKPLILLYPTFKHQQHLKAFESEVGLKFFDHAKDLIVLCDDKFRGFSNKQTQLLFERLLADLGLKSFDCVPVDHRTFKSFGCCFVTEDRFKVAYSGDTLPCLNLIKAASNADLLLHEATHTDDKKYEALCAKHSTISEAIHVHDLSKAKFTILTHFTHRYSKCVPLDIPELQGRQDVGIAFDHLDITPDLLPVLPKLVEGYKMVFQDHLDKFLDNRKYSYLVEAQREKVKSEQEVKKVKLDSDSV